MAKKSDLTTISDADLAAEVIRRQEEKLAAEEKTKAEAKRTKEAKQKEALAQIEVEVEKAYAALRAAEKLADEAGVSFHFSPAYGMGGAYYGKDSEEGYGDTGWSSSSQNC